MNVRSAPESSQSAVWKTIILALALMVNVALISRFFWGPQSIASYRELASQYQDFTQQIASLDAGNASLSREIRLLQTDATYGEKMIRQRLNFVRDNEILYLFPNEQKAPGARVE